jgi:DNA invertase Pin-like site-specific DNA recombinase
VQADLLGEDQHIKIRPELEAARQLARDIKQAAPGQDVIVTVHEIKRLARNAAELMTLTAALQADGIQLELLTGPLTGIYDPNGLGSMLFAVLAVAAQLDRDYIRQKTLEGQRAAAAKGNHGGRPKVLDEDMIIFARALHDKGVPVPEIAAKLVIKTGKNAGKHPPSPRSTAPSPMTRQQQRRLPPDQCHRPIDPVTGR